MRNFINKASSYIARRTSDNPYWINWGVQFNNAYNERLAELPYVLDRIQADKLNVLDIGCCESVLSIMLSAMGHKVTGIDLRNYLFTNQNFTFIKDDFLKHEFTDKFDCIIDVSAIEHFGIAVQAYGSTNQTNDADVEAMQKIHSLLETDGQFLFTAPYGLHSVSDTMRTYDADDIARLFNGFKIIDKSYFLLTANRNGITKIDNSNIYHHSLLTACIDARRCADV